MKLFYCLSALILATTLNGEDKPLPVEMRKIMDQPKYEHAIWGLYVKDLATGEVLYDHNSDLLFSPASTTKLFSVEALLRAYGDDYRFKTPVYAVGKIDKGILQGDLVLVGQGDLTFGGRQSNPNQIAFTKLDHIIANNVPGVILTKEDPLNGINDLAKQIAHKGIKEIHGDVLVDENLFEAITLRGMRVSPVMVNENLIDIIMNPTTVGQAAKLTWRPLVPGYTVTSQVKTAWEEEVLEIASQNQKITIKGAIAPGQKDVVRTASIEQPAKYARAALMYALERQGVKIFLGAKKTTLPANYQKGLQPIAVWTSPPLSEYAKLILKVSHNLGADLVPLLLAAKDGKKTFSEGMHLLGDFLIQDAKIPHDSFVFIDAAGGNDNRMTPKAAVQLLEFIHNQPEEQFGKFYDALPILGVDGSLEDFAKATAGAGKVRAKPGTGMVYSEATDEYFLVTQALAGYIEARNGHMLAYMLVVNNGTAPKIQDVLGAFEDEGQISNHIYLNSGEKE